MDDTHSINVSQAPQKRRKRFYIGLAITLLLVAGVSYQIYRSLSSSTTQGININDRNWSADAIIAGGATTKKEMISKYDQNVAGVQGIFKYYGIERSDLTEDTSEIKIGTVYQNGNVVVDGKTVAVNAKSVSRKPFYDAHGNGPVTRTINGVNLYEGPNMSIFVRAVDAYVFYRDGQFYRAIIASCANPVIAQPTEPKKPKPVYTCDSLQAERITHNRFRFTASATAKNDASVTSYTFDFGDGSKPVTTKSASDRVVEHTYTSRTGNFTTKVTANVRAEGTNKATTSTNCQYTVKANEPPKQPISRCDSLQATKISRNQYRLTATATALNGPRIINYTFDFGDGSKPVTVADRNYTYTYPKAGDFTAKVTANIRDGNTTRPITGNACQTPVKVEPAPVFSCDSLIASKINRRNFDFTAAATAKHGAQVVNYTFDFGDGSPHRTITGQTTSYTYENPGTYTVKLTVNFRVNGEGQTLSGTACQTTIIVEEPPAIPAYKCDLLTAKAVIESDRKYAYDLTYTAESGANLTKIVVDFGDGKVETYSRSDIDKIEHQYADYGEYITTATLYFNVQEEDGVVERRSSCEEELSVQKPEPCPVPGKEHLPKNDEGCTEPPIETPPELPQTGLGTWVSGGVGLAALAGAAYYWRASQSNLRNTKLKK